ncbi:MAG: DUF2071 domain-containing protein [Planctomycetes bacterium]|nr:DUF2071 domain-containing protein [Planctomycetota bacterium]
MPLPTIRGLIDRRVLVNFRVDPDVLARVLPAPFRPQVVGGYGIAGICLIRLSQIRPLGWPAAWGLRSENAAHRIAVEWDNQGQVQRGVFVPRRDTSSFWNSLAGGRLFPGVYHHSKFEVRETPDEYAVAFQNPDGMQLSVEGRVSESVPPDSVFPTLAAASDFFLQGAVGYSPGKHQGQFDGMKLCTTTWDMTALAISHVSSSWFSDPSRFPPGSLVFDSAFLMRQIAHEWRGTEGISIPQAAATCCE